MRKYIASFVFVTLFVLLASVKGKELKVLQMNIWQESTLVEGGFDAIVEQINHISPDVVLLCEIRDFDSPFIPRFLNALKENGSVYYGESSSIGDVGIVKIEMFQAAIARIVKENHNQHDFSLGHRGITMIFPLIKRF